MRVGELEQAELLARVDLEVLAELALVGRGDGQGRQQLDVDVGLPRGVLGVLDEAVAAEQLGEPYPVERPARAGAPPGPGDALAQGGVVGARPRGVAQRRVGVGQQQVADRGRLGRLEVGVVGGERRGRRARVARERGSLVDERLVQLADARAGHKPHTHPERLAARAPCTQPAGGGAADTPLQLGLARVEGIAEGGIPRKVCAGDLVQLEQPAQQRLRIVAGQVAALDERDRMREVGEREAVRQARPVGALGRERGSDELARSSPAQAPAAPQLLGSAHAAETTRSRRRPSAPGPAASPQAPRGQVPCTRPCLDHPWPGPGTPGPTAAAIA